VFEKVRPVASQAGSKTSGQSRQGGRALVAPVPEVSADKAINNVKATILIVVFMASPFSKLFIALVWYYSGWLKNRPRYDSWTGELVKVATRAAWSFYLSMATIRLRIRHHDWEALFSK
jgi:hypothetical protein